MREIANASIQTNKKLGDLSIKCIEELLSALREFVVEGVEMEPSLRGYVATFDQAVELEVKYLHGLPDKLKMELGLSLFTRGMLDEMEALHELLVSPLSGTDEEKKKQKEKKKKGAVTLKKELSAIWPSWLPKWIETIIESVLSLL